MTRYHIALSSCALDVDRDPLREPSRLMTLRHEDFEDRFDFTTLYYDCFWRAQGDSAVLIGPPSFNLERDLDLKFFAHPSGVQCNWKAWGSHSITRHEVFLPSGSNALIVVAGDNSFFVTPQPNLSRLFHDRRVITTISKNNELTWVKDWATYYSRIHHCDAALIYDNGSDLYNISQFYDELKGLLPHMRVVIVPWDFKYGVADYRRPVSYQVADALFCQKGMLEHARFRFLETCRSTLNVDIDELVAPSGNATVFELVERSRSGYITVSGKWVENWPAGGEGEQGPPRHKEFSFVENSDMAGCEPKWAAVPAKTPKAAQWSIHKIYGVSPSEPDAEVQFWHFKAINTNWQLDRARSQQLRTASLPADPDNLCPDEALRAALQQAFTGATDEPQRAPEPVLRRAYRLRVEAGRLAAAGQTRDAIAAATAAAALMPDHPGLRLFHAKLHAIEDDAAAAKEHTAAAEAIQNGDAWFHFQQGQWNRDEGNLAAARACYERAIGIDPSLYVAYHQLAQLHSVLGQPGRALPLLEECVRHAPRQPVAHALLAKELERRRRLLEALQCAETAVSLDPANPHFLHLHATLLRQLKRFADARKVLKNGLASNRLADRMQVFDERWSAIDVWMTVEWHVPAAPELQVEIVEYFAGQGNLGAAERAARRCLALSETPARYARHAEILALLGRNSEAEAALQRGIALAKRVATRPTSNAIGFVSRMRSRISQAYEHARLLRLAGRPAEAISVLQAVLALPGSTRARRQLAALWAEEGALNTAIELLREAIARHPEEVSLYADASRLLAEHELAAAISQAHSCVALEPDNPMHRRYLANLLLEAGRDDEAEQSLAGGLTIRDGEIRRQLSQLLRRGGRIAEAIEIARSAVEIDRPNPTLWDHQASLLWEAGSIEQAEAVLRGALSEGIESGAICHQLSRLQQEKIADPVAEDASDPADWPDGEMNGGGDAGSQVTAWDSPRVPARSLQRDEIEAEALELARRAVELEPQRAAFAIHLADLLIQVGEAEAAEQALHAALQRCPLQGGLRFHLSRLLHSWGRHAEALSEAAAAARSQPEVAYLHRHFATLLRQAGRMEDAELALREALGQHPDEAELHFQLSKVLQGLDRHEEAESAARRATALEPAKASFREALAVMLLERGLAEEAEAVLRDAVEEGAASASIHYRLSRLLLQRGCLEQAVTAAEEALRADPDKSHLHLYLGVVLIEAGRCREAEEVLQGALRMRPGDAEVYFRLSQALRHLQRPDDATGYARRAVELDPRRSRLWDHLSDLLQEQGLAGEAEEVLRQALREGTESATIHLRISRLAQERGCLDKALASAADAVRLEPTKSYLHRHHGAVLLQAGRVADAERALCEAVRLEPESAEAHFELSRTLAQLQRPVEAAESAARAVALKPDRRDYRKHHSALLRAQSRADEPEAIQTSTERPVQKRRRPARSRPSPKDGISLAPSPSPVHASVRPPESPACEGEIGRRPPGARPVSRDGRAP